MLLQFYHGRNTLSFLHMSFLSAEHWHLPTYISCMYNLLSQLQHSNLARSTSWSTFTGRGPEHQLTQTNRWVLATSYVAVFTSTVLFCTKYCNITNSILDTLHLIPLYAQQARKSVVWTNLVIITHILHRVMNWLSLLLHLPWTVTPYSSELNKYTKGDA